MSDDVNDQVTVLVIDRRDLRGDRGEIHNLAHTPLQLRSVYDYSPSLRSVRHRIVR